MGQCRNCGKDTTTDLGPIGVIAPFFLKRVLNLEHGIAPARNPVKRFLRGIPLLGKVSRKVYGAEVLTDMEICQSCNFIQTRIPFADESIARLYSDYRAESYNRERIRYEPSYAAIAPHVGSCAQEVDARIIGLTQWLQSRLKPDSQFTMLDFGGADGKFLPAVSGAKYVYEISDIAPVAGVTRIEREADLTTYSYVQLAHVLEHVPHPLLLTKKAASCVKPGGHLYIEVPLEISDDEISRLLAGDNPFALPIHEHINLYSVRSMTELLNSVGLDVKTVETEPLDLGWCRGRIIRALSQRPS